MLLGKARGGNVGSLKSQKEKQESAWEGLPAEAAPGYWYKNRSPHPTDPSIGEQVTC